MFRAFSDPVAFAVWLPPYGFVCTVQQFDFKVQGHFKMTFINFSTGNGHSFGGEYLEIIPNTTIKYVDRFDDPNLPGDIITKITLNKVSCGTAIFITQEHLPDLIPIELCYLGWQDSLQKMKNLVEPEIPDAS